MTYLGWKIYYADGTVVSSKYTAWKDAPAEGIQVVAVFFKETYKIWHEDHFDVENYCKILHSQDYYWALNGEIQAGSALDVPGSLPDRALKVGMLMDDADFARIYDKAKEQRVF